MRWAELQLNLQPGSLLTRGADKQHLVRGSAVNLHLKEKPDPAQDLSDLPPICADMSFCRFIGSEIYKDHFKLGMYVCSQCSHPLFSSRSKFPHSSPWPAFTDTIRDDSVTKMMETLTAFKVLCGKCGNGLGHEFVNDGPQEGVSRFWIFSHSLKFVPSKGNDKQ